MTFVTLCNAPVPCLLSCGLKAGPLYYGFSELTTQQAVAALYNETELRAAMQVRCLLGVAATFCSKTALRAVTHHTPLQKTVQAEVALEICW